LHTANAHLLVECHEFEPPQPRHVERDELDAGATQHDDQRETGQLEIARPRYRGKGGAS
jgi:hypothetical protein